MAKYLVYKDNVTNQVEYDGTDGNKVYLVSPITLKTGLISVWEFDEPSGAVAYDSHNSNHLTINSATINQTGKINKCYLYNASTNQLTLAANLATPFENLSSISVSAWVYPTYADDYDQYRMIVSKMKSTWTSPYYEFHLRARLGGYQVYEFVVGTVNNTFGGRSTTVNSYVAGGGWVHLVGTYTPDGVCNIYRNGELNNAGGSNIAGGGNIYNVSSPLNIGDDDDKYANFLNWGGNIDQIAIWNVALTQNQITDLYNGGAGLAYANW